MSVTPEQADHVYREADCLFDQQAVDNAFNKLASEITEQLAETNPLVLAVMTGGIIPAGILLPKLPFPLELDYVHATRYRGETAGGTLHWIAHPSTPLKDRTVLLVDDILDEGITLAEIVKACFNEGAKAVYTAVLVNKIHDRKADIRADFVGLDVEDRYLFGYGMDYKNYLRNAAGIYAVKGL